MFEHSLLETSSVKKRKNYSLQIEDLVLLIGPSEAKQEVKKALWYQLDTPI